MPDSSALADAPPPGLDVFIDLHPPVSDFRADVIAGLSAAQKHVSPKYLYDAQGSALFDAICRQPEYYVPETETAILRDAAPDIARWVGRGAEVIELGSGSSLKIRILLDALDAPELYLGVDISKAHLVNAAQALSTDYAGLRVGAICADFTQPLEVDPDIWTEGRRVAFFPGSTLGNFDAEERKAILSAVRGLVRPGDGLLLGVDLRKDPAVLNAAYNDAAGVTAAFSLNVLARINRELEGEFDLDTFAHRAFYNAESGRMELYLESLKAQSVRAAGAVFDFAAGERIHTEYSYKFTNAMIAAEAAPAGWSLDADYQDERGYFSLFRLAAV
ncbi:MAG: L-histidine N(alpha)-methyltransferase [Maricaulaceae bacterium]